MTERPEIWTPALISELGAMWLEGQTLSEIAERLGMTRNAIGAKARRLGLPERGNPVDRSKIKPVVMEQPGHGCRFIEGEDFLERQRRGEEIFCRRSVCAEGVSWCEEHMRVVFVRHTVGHQWFSRTMDNLSETEMTLYRKLRAKGIPATAALKQAAAA